MAKTKILPLVNSARQNLITYEKALKLFKAAGLCSCLRTVRTHIWANPHVCPVFKEGYHHRRVRQGDVERLIVLIAKKYPTRTRQPFSE